MMVRGVLVAVRWCLERIFHGVQKRGIILTEGGGGLARGGRESETDLRDLIAPAEPELLTRGWEQ